MAGFAIAIGENRHQQQQPRPYLALLAFFVGAALGGLLVEFSHHPDAPVLIRRARGAAWGWPPRTGAYPPPPPPPPLPAGGAVAGNDTAANATAVFQFELPPRTLDKGVVTHGDTARARQALAKLAAGRPVSVSFVGGSSTWGIGSLGPDLKATSFAGQVLKWINQTFPHPDHKLINGARFAATSMYFELCSPRHVPEDADLVFVELNLNDDFGGSDSPIRRAHERLLRRLLQLPNRPAVVELVLYKHPWLPLRHQIRVPFRWAGDDELTVLSVFYRLPMLSTRSLAWGEIGLPPEGPPPVPEDPPWAATPDWNNETGKYTKLWFDSLGHPSVAGHKWIAELIIWWMQGHLEELARRPLGPEDEEGAREPLPTPIYPYNWGTKLSTCFLEESIESLVKARDSFEWVNEGTEQKAKWGFVSTKPGSTIRLQFSTNMEGVTGNVTLAVGYLRSYERMGQFEVSCVQGCACETQQINSHAPEFKHSQLMLSQIGVTKADACHVQLRVLEGSTSGEHKVKLLGIMMSESPTSDFARWNGNIFEEHV